MNAAKYYGIKFVERNQYNELIIENDHHQYSQVYKYELLHAIEFTSERKRMSVIVKAPNGEIRVLCKGADTVLAPLIAEDSLNKELKKKTLQHIVDYSVEGFRTFMICERTISQSFYRSWSYKYEQAKAAFNHKSLKIQNVVSELEKDFNILGAAAIEDLVQDRAQETVKQIKTAGIRFWMLSGDKLETTVNIGFSCELLNPGMQIFKINQESMQEIMNYISMALKRVQSEHQHVAFVSPGHEEYEEKPEFAIVVTGETFFKI